jgi:deazaflavin-dependent oxidoreductase (nitroreductase family)
MRSGIEDLADKPVLYLTTVGRKTERQLEIDIWFVVFGGSFYLFAEKGEAANWVRNIRHRPGVRVRIEDRQISATARVLDREADRELWGRVTGIADRKYGWGDGLPVEITPNFSSETV